MSEPFERVGNVDVVHYEFTLKEEEARSGTTRRLTRQSKTLEIKIPAGVKTGSIVRLSNSLQLTDGRPGDILVHIKIEGESMPASVLAVNDKDFESEILKSTLPVVLDLWAPWCGPCRMIAPITEKLAKEYAGRIKFCKINVDENRLVASKYMVQSIPLLLLFKNGRVVDQIIGAVPEQALRTKVEVLLWH
jgi:thioredoxin 1